MSETVFAGRAPPLIRLTPRAFLSRPERAR